MTEKEKFLFAEKKTRIYIERGGVCEACFKAIPIQEAQLAHKLPQTKYNLKQYGKDYIHHPFNISLVCSLKCNSSISIAHNPESIMELLLDIQEDIGDYE